MICMSRLILLVTMLLVTLSRADAANWVWHDDDLFLVGTIENDDSIELLFALASRTNLPRRLVLRSPGGSVSEALKIGRMIRKYRLVVGAPSHPFGDFICNLEDDVSGGNCTCASACALVWFGGVYRQGSVGVHRSFIVDENLSFTEYENGLEGSRMRISSFLSEMRIPKWVEDKMFETSSEDIAIISASSPTELFKPWQLHPISIDPTFQEYALRICGDESSSVYKNMGCYIQAIIQAQNERENVRWYDTTALYLDTFADLRAEPYMSYFDSELRDVTGSEAHGGDNWLDQLGRAHERTHEKHPNISPPDWWVAGH